MKRNMDLKKRLSIFIFSIVTFALLLYSHSYSNPILEHIYQPNLILLNYSVSNDLQSDLDSIFEKMENIFKDLKSILGLDQDYPIKFIVTILFYLSLGFFILFWFIEAIFRFFKKLLDREHKEIRPKKMARIAFKTTLVGKLLLLCFTALGLFSQAVSMSEFYRTYIKKPENLISLIQRDRVFLIILGLTLAFYLIRRRIFR